MDLNEIKSKLEAIAYTKSKPFCYYCYQEAPSGKCKSCQSDDLMRLLPAIGCEYGIDWIVEHLIEQNLDSVDTDEIFEQMIDDCYGETVKVGFMELATVDVMKNQDPVYWNIAKNEYIDGLVDDEQLLTFDNWNTYYWIHDVEEYISENDTESEEAS